MNTHDKIELPEYDCLYETTNEDGFIDVEPAYRKSTVLRLIEADRQRRGEPVAYGIKAANTGKIAIVLYGSDVDQVGEYRADLVVPLYTTPHQAEPDDPNTSPRSCKGPFESASDLINSINEPVNMPSDDEIIDTAISSGLVFRDSAGDVLCAWREDTDISEYLIENARAVLARYGQPVEPEGWQLVPKEPSKEMLSATSWPNCAGTDYKHMLAAAPKFGEEE